MALTINTNIASLIAQNNLSNSQTNAAQSIQRLSTGLRINNAADDAAGMAIAQRTTAIINGYTQASQNANDAISMVQTADGGLGQITADLQRMRTLAVQAANGTNSTEDMAALQTESSKVSDEITRVANGTTFNGISLLDGTQTASTTFQIGATNNAAYDQVTADFTNDNTASSLGVDAIDLSTQAGAQDAIDTIDAALETVNTNRTSLGATQNTLTSVISQLQNATQNMSAYRSSVLDTNFASETAAMTKNQVLQQAGVAMLAQANSAPNVVLKLLQ